MGIHIHTKVYWTGFGNNIFGKILPLLFLLSLFSPAQAAVSQITPKKIYTPPVKLPVRIPKKIKLPTRTVPGLHCRSTDPAISGVRIEQTRRYENGNSRVVIRGNIVNAGSVAYALAERPLLITLREAGTHSLIGHRTFDRGSLNPAPAGARNFSFTVTVSGGGDLVPDYELALTQNLRTGAVPTGAVGNCRPGNDKHIVTGAQINAALAAHVQTSMHITRIRACIRPGRGLVIDGVGFGASPTPSWGGQARTVWFDNQKGDIMSWTDRQLIIKAPTNLDPRHNVTISLRTSSAPDSASLTHFAKNVCPAVNAPATTTATAADFKFGTMLNAYDRSAARGARPLVVLLLQARPGEGKTPALIHNAAYFDRLLFGSNYPNIVNFYKVNSYYSDRDKRGMTWRKAAILGPVVDTTPADKDRFLTVQGMIAAAGFDFAAYDRNRDGTVSERELGILVVDNFGDWGGQSSAYPGCVKVRGRSNGGKKINVCSGVSNVSQKATFATFAHELSHQLGTIDIYGSSCLSMGLSLMSCTGGTGNPDSTYILDPWHRSRLGWLKPRIYPMTRAGAADLREPSQLYGQPYNGGPIILYDPRRGTNEFFMVEFRERQRTGPRASSPDNAYGYDADAPENGVAVWHVKTDAAGNLLQIPDRIPESRNHKCGDKDEDGSNYRISPQIVARRLREAAIARPTQIPGVGLSCGKVSSAVVVSPAGHGGLKGGWGGRALWRPSDGSFTLNWLTPANDADGPDTGVVFRVYDMGKGFARIRWDPR